MIKLSRKIKIGLVLIIVLTLWVFLAPLLAILLIVDRTIQKADAIWVLGGSSTYLERNQKAAQEFREGYASHIFIVNDGNFGAWNQIEKKNLPYSELSKRELIAQGVPENAIEILPRLVEGTRDEADLFAEIARDRKLNSVLLITSSYHSRRTLWTFDRAVLKNNLSLEIGLQSPPPGQQTPTVFTWWLSQKGWMVVGEEYVKILYYWVFY